MRFNALVGYARRPQVLVVAGLLIVALGLWAAGNGRLPTGPQPSTAAEARLAPVLQSPRPSDRQVTKVVTTLMKREHLSKHPLDDEISRRGLQLFIKSLDGMKLYFYQSDIDELTAARTSSTT